MTKKKPPSGGNPHLVQLRKRIQKAPMDAGIYRWLGKEGEVLYIGKAKNLRNRLKSYVQEQPDAGIGPWKLSLIKNIEDVEMTVTNSELEALILETNLIKEIKPKYNVLMKDDKNYVYVRISVQNPYPVVDVVRRMEDDGAQYFGPYLKAYEAKRALDMLQEVYNYREDSKALEKLNRAGEEAVQKHASLDFQIGQSCGVAMGKISQEEYRRRIDAVVQFFKGDTTDVLQQAKERMQQAAQDRKFERAAKLRDAVQFIETMQKEQVVSDTSREDTDTFAVAMSGTRALVVVLRERNGRVIGEQSYSLRGEPESAANALEQFLPQYYSSVPDLPDLVVIGETIEDPALLSDWLTERKNRKVDVRIPERGKKSHVLKLAEKNAVEKIKQQEAKWESAARNLEEALAELQDVLHLPNAPRRIEGYDISHLGGTETVGSMVVAIHGKPMNKHYRSFTIQSLKEGDVDDYKALEEVLRRRLKYLSKSLKEQEEDWKEQGFTFRKARKAEQNPVEEIIKEYPRDLNPEGANYKDFLVGRKDEKIIAFVRSYTHTGNLVELRSLWVHKDVRGEKLGHLLLRKMLKTLKKEKVYVTTEPKLQEYYAEAGFRHVLRPPEVLADAMQKAAKECPACTNAIAMVYIASEHKEDASLAERPDLLLIDGGKGQLGSALKVLKNFALELPVIGLAKREEEIFLPSQKNPVLLPKDSQAQFLLQRIRNEAHRFANAHRRKRVAKHAIGSALDAVPGIGTKTKQVLLKNFGSVKNISEASDAELAKMLNREQIGALRKHLA
ncbi:hypothetical protein COU76_05850 [Candidatus Peregrinibacteria bacterium CG10_big_fil_rev_8_21_14_0_10_49_10]|nr:MAG: hypothetical protein COU76_05850 [Candidatus Peregrinibacteria bacterium CG10_big_fil_rev_8_21_14_0_10_49_10]